MVGLRSPVSGRVHTPARPVSVACMKISVFPSRDQQVGLGATGVVNQISSIPAPFAGLCAITYFSCRLAPYATWFPSGDHTAYWLGPASSVNFVVVPRANPSSQISNLPNEESRNSIASVPPSGESAGRRNAPRVVTGPSTFPARSNQFNGTAWTLPLAKYASTPVSEIVNAPLLLLTSQSAGSAIGNGSPVASRRPA